MNELEKKIYEAIVTSGGSIILKSLRDNMAKQVTKIALEEIKAAFNAGEDYGDGENHYPDLNAYLKQKGYE